MATDFHFSIQQVRRFRQAQILLDRLHPEEQPVAFVMPHSPEPGREIIVFPGSFNPPTTAHLAMLKQARQVALLRSEQAQKGTRTVQLYAAMSKLIVDKEHVERPLMLDRVILLEDLLRQRLPHTGVMVFNRGLYVEQAEAVHRCFHRVKKLYFLLGYDKIVQILDPHYYQDRDASLKDLFALAELLVAPRAGSGARELAELVGKPENQQFARYIHPLPFSDAYRDVSSTRIRQHLREHRNDVPREVRDFMRKTRAYDSPLHLPDGSQIDCYGEREKALQALLNGATDGTLAYLTQSAPRRLR